MATSLPSDAPLARSYVAGTGPFPGRAAVLALTGGFITDFGDMVGAWAECAASVTDQRSDDPRLAEPAWSVLQDIAPRGRASHDGSR